MCTALSFNTREHYFGRNLDLDRSYGEQVVVMPRRFPLAFRHIGAMSRHYAFIGMATVVGGVPLFYDAVNEHGLAMAGLNFPDNAVYSPSEDGKDNITSFELIPWILGQCRSVSEAREMLMRINITDDAFSEELAPSPLHFMICDKEQSIVAEPMRDGLHIHDNGLGVLTNNPPFEYQVQNLAQYRDLRVDNSEIVKNDNLPYSEYCQGLGAVGLPGDVSSKSRFVRSVFVKENSECEGDELPSVSQFFHILSSVEMPRGVCKTDEGKNDITVYSSCMNTQRGLYYYTTYDNRRLSCIDMHKADLDSDTVSKFPLKMKQDIYYQS